MCYVLMLIRFNVAWFYKSYVVIYRFFLAFEARCINSIYYDCIFCYNCY